MLGKEYLWARKYKKMEPFAPWDAPATFLQKNGADGRA